MQEGLSQLSGYLRDENGHAFEPGTTVFTNGTARGIIKVVAAGICAEDVQEHGEAQRSSHTRKTFEACLLTWEFDRREQRPGRME